MADDERDDADAVPTFPIALRGYDRESVHSFAVAAVREVSALRRELAGLLQRATTAEAQLAAVQRENQTLREGYSTLTRGTSVPTGTGARIERLLQAAEEEAVEVRTGAVREATRLLEQAREQADSHLRAAADEIAGRRAAHDQEIRRREARVRADEQRAADRLRDVQEAAERQRTEAEERARHLLAAAGADAAAIRAGAKAEAGDVLDRARDEIDRLVAAERSARADLTRLLTAISAGLPAGEEGGGARTAGGEDATDDPTADDPTDPTSGVVATSDPTGELDDPDGDRGDDGNRDLDGGTDRTVASTVASTGADAATATDAARPDADGRDATSTDAGADTGTDTTGTAGSTPAEDGSGVRADGRPADDRGAVDRRADGAAGSGADGSGAGAADDGSAGDAAVLRLPHPVAAR